METIFQKTEIKTAASAAAKLLQSCPTLCDPIDGSPPGSSVPGILQARTPEWVAISFSNAWKSKVKVKSLSHVWLFATPWTAAYQAPPSMGVSRQEYWSGVPLARCQQLKDKLNRNIYLFTLSTKQFGNIDILQPTNSTSRNSFQGSSEKLLIWTWYCVGKEKMNSWQR